MNDKTDTNHTVSIRITDHTFKVRCNPENINELRNAADLVNQTMQAIKQGGKILGTDKVAMLTALQVAHKLQTSEKQNRRLCEDLQTQLQQITNKVLSSLPEVVE